MGHTITEREITTLRDRLEELLLKIEGPKCTVDLSDLREAYRMLNHALSAENDLDWQQRANEAYRYGQESAKGFFEQHKRKVTE